MRFRPKFDRINFRTYRRPLYLIACFDAWGVGHLFAGVNVKRSPCPFCSPPGNKERVFSWHFPSCSFYCHRCGKRGDALQMVQYKLGCSVVDAAKWLEVKTGPTDSGLVMSAGHA